MITGLYETHIQVSSLERSMEFYDGLPGLQMAMVDWSRNIAFFWIGKQGEAMLGLWENKKPFASQHFAFRSSVDYILNDAVPFLNSMKIECYNFLKDGTSKPMVFGWSSTIAIYFRDPDNHELELIATLPQSPRPELGIISYEKWIAATGNDDPAEPGDNLAGPARRI